MVLNLGRRGLLNGWSHMQNHFKTFATVSSTAQSASVESTSFGALSTGEDVSLYKICNNKDMSIEVINYGGHIRSVNVPTANNTITDVVIGLDTIEDYEKFGHFYFGCITGRYCNRIKEGQFDLNNRKYQLPLNNGNHHLHGGPDGFHKKLWKIDSIIDENDNGNKNKVGIRLNYVSPHLEEGYPGELDIFVEYLLYKDVNKLEMNYKAKMTDSEANKGVNSTIVNLTNHSYWNLLDSGNNSNKFDENSILDSHELNLIASDTLTKIDSECIPTGHYMKVTSVPDKHGFHMKAIDPPFDFYKEYVNIGKHIGDVFNEQIVNGAGYDHNFIINRNYDELSGDFFFCCCVLLYLGIFVMTFSWDFLFILFFGVFCVAVLVLSNVI